MNNRLRFLVFFNIISINLFCQVIISPEIGYNYRPYVLHVSSNIYSEVKHVSPEFYTAVKGDIGLSNKLYLQTKVGYIFRKKNSVPYIAFDPSPDITFFNQDLFLDIGILYSITNKIKVGLGGGFYHKLNSHTYNNPDNRNHVYDLNRKFLYNTHFQLVYRLYKNLSIMTMYQYLFDTELPPHIGLMILDGGHHAFSIGVSYDLVKSKHSK